MKTEEEYKVTCNDCMGSVVVRIEPNTEGSFIYPRFENERSSSIKLSTTSCVLMPQKNDVLLWTKNEECGLNKSLNSWRFSRWPGNIAFLKWIEDFSQHNNLSAPFRKRKSSVPLSLTATRMNIGCIVINHFANRGVRFLKQEDCQCLGVQIPVNDCYCRFHKWKEADLLEVSLAVEAILNVKYDIKQESKMPTSNTATRTRRIKTNKKRKEIVVRFQPLNQPCESISAESELYPQHLGRCGGTSAIKVETPNDTINENDRGEQNKCDVLNNGFYPGFGVLSMCDIVKLRKRSTSIFVEAEYVNSDSLKMEIDEAEHRNVLKREHLKFTTNKSPSSLVVPLHEDHVNTTSSSKKRKIRNRKGDDMLDNLNSTCGEASNTVPLVDAATKKSITIDKQSIPTFAEPIKQDILLVGKGNFCFRPFFKWPGNVYFHKVVENFASASVSRETTITIMNEMFRIGGRFLYGTRKKNAAQPIKEEKAENRFSQQVDPVKQSPFSEDSYHWVVIEAQQRILDLINKAVRMNQNSRQASGCVNQDYEPIVDTVNNLDSAVEKWTPHAAKESPEHMAELLESVASASPSVAGDNTSVVQVNTTGSVVNSSQEEHYILPTINLALERIPTFNSTLEADRAMQLPDTRLRARLSPEKLSQLQHELNEVCARIQINDPAVTCVDIADGFTDDMVATLGQTLYHNVTENEIDKQHIKAMGLEISCLSTAIIRKNAFDSPYRSLFLFLEKSPVLRTVFLNGCDLASVPVGEALMNTLAKSSSIKYLMVCNMSFTLSSFRSLLCKTSSIEEIELEACTLVPYERTDQLSERDDASRTDTKMAAFGNCSLKHVAFKGEDCFRDQFLIPILELLIFCEQLEKVSWIHQDDASNHNLVTTDISSEAWYGLAQLITKCKMLNHLSFSSWNFRGNDILVLSQAIQSRQSSTCQVSFAASCRADAAASKGIASLFSDLPYVKDSLNVCTNKECPRPQRGATALHIGSGCRFPMKNVVKFVENVLNNPYSSLEHLSLRSLAAMHLDALLWQIGSVKSSLKRLDLGSGCISDEPRWRILLHAIPHFQYLQELNLDIDLESNKKNRKGKDTLEIKPLMLDAMKRNGSLFQVNVVHDDGNVMNDDGSYGLRPPPISVWTTEEMRMIEGFLKRNKFLSDPNNFVASPTAFPLVASCAIQCEYSSWVIFGGLLALGSYERESIVEKNKTGANHQELQSSSVNVVHV